jgi:HD-like signal output (HDOD) protein
MNRCHQAPSVWHKSPAAFAEKELAFPRVLPGAHTGNTMLRSETKRQSELQTAAVRDHLDACIRQERLRLPMLAEAVSEAMEMCNAPDTSADDISNVIHRDQNLAGQVLRAANSPLVGSPTPTLSLQQALTRLGLRQVVEIVLTASLKASIFESKRHAPLMTYLWQHAVATGCFVKDIARARHDRGQGYFVCGLFHNVGKPMVLNALATFETTLAEPIIETDILLAMNEYHIAVGGALADSWNLPTQVVESVLYYHDYTEAPSYRNVATMVNLASQLAAFLVCTDEPAVPADAEDLARMPVCRELGFSANDVDGLLARLERIRALVDSTL